jgi:hypothetical protein
MSCRAKVLSVIGLTALAAAVLALTFSAYLSPDMLVEFAFRLCS